MKSAAMTPFKQPGAGRRFFRNEDEMDAESACESLDSSPSESALRSTAKSRLFSDYDDDVDDAFSFSLQSGDLKTGRTPARNSLGNEGKKILKPVDLNLSFEGEDEDEGGAPASPPTSYTTSSVFSANDHKFQRHKRFQKLASKGTPVASFCSGDSDSAMISSPYISPSSYITMDGRCVTSKNPFSPMITDESNTKTHQLAAATRTAPSFPVSFDTYGSSTAAVDSLNGQDSAAQGGIAPPTCRHRLQKREGTPTKRSFLYGSFSTRNGYPERHGRYSFTGSPIKEDEEMSVSASPSVYAAHKIRRLGIHDDVHYPAGKRNKQLSIDTQEQQREDSMSSSASSFEEISPTDIMSFPAPPTPTKGKKAFNHYPRTSQPPGTPFLSRSAKHPRRRGHHDEGRHDFDDSSSFTSDDSSAKPVPPSRFKSDFDIISELGKGSFGAVYKVLSRLDGCFYAVKSALRQVKGNADRDRMLKEVYALAALSDQADPATFHIVRYHQAWMEDDRLYIQTELCSSNLADEIAASGGHLSTERRWKLLREMLLALEFIHRSNNGMCHLDIKPENIFVKKDGPLNVFKLGDFGLVAKLDFHRDVEEGDSRYMSMELLSGDHQDLTKSDIFSLGATLYEISLGRPLPMNGEEWQAIRAGSLQPLPDTPYEMEMIIRECMHPTYASRPSAGELLKRPQLLSDEQKMLMSERNKVFQAKLALAQQQRNFKKAPPPLPAAGGLVRRNTWSGGYF